MYSDKYSQAYAVTSNAMTLNVSHLKNYLSKQYLPDLDIKMTPENFIRQAVEVSGTDTDVALHFWEKRIKSNPAAQMAYSEFVSRLPREPEPQASPAEMLPSEAADSASSSDSDSSSSDSDSMTSSEEEEEEEEDLNEQRRLDWDDMELARTLARLRIKYAHRLSNSGLTQGSMHDSTSTVLNGKTSIDVLIERVNGYKDALIAVKSKDSYSPQLLHAMQFAEDTRRLSTF